jgi:hypothetical protein
MILEFFQSELYNESKMIWTSKKIEEMVEKNTLKNGGTRI